MAAGESIPGAIPAAVALLVGVLAMQWLPHLPPLWSMGLLLSVVGVLLWRFPQWHWLGWIALGFAWAAWRGAAGMDVRLPRALEGQDLEVTGRIVDLSQGRSDASRFTLWVESAALDDKAVDLRGRVSVSWYDDAPELPPCSRWHLRLRLKRPRGLMNPGVTDSERSALERGKVASGYVRVDPANALLAASPWCVNRLRNAIAKAIAARVSNPRDAALLQALAVGDTRGLSDHDWEVARANGVSHLLAISGFHVGVAAVFGVWLTLLAYALWPRLGHHLPRPQAQAVSALLLAIVYSLLAGFGLPTVRTLLMIAVVALARCTRRANSGAQSLALALLAILLFDPLAVLAAGFWFSFVGVALLILCLHARGRGWRAFLHELTSAQMLMTVALLPLTLWFFGQASLIGALSNLIAVPLVSFVIVPCTLIGMLLLGLYSPLAAPVLWLAAQVVHVQWRLFEYMAGWPGAHWYLPAVSAWALGLAMLGALWLFMPRGIPLRWLGLLLFLPLLWPVRTVPVDGAFRAWVLDVGQGLSVLVQTHDHAMVYDAGARFPSGFDLGQSVVLPSLHALGINRLDLLMISHGDNDHAGGARSVAQAFPQAMRYAGEPARMPMPMRQCLAGQSWSWNGVHFRVLNPQPDQAGPGNGHSCVLLIEGQGGRLLLTGDISSAVESQVAQALGPGTAPIMLVPHHGSASSSGAGFIAAVQPELAVVSAGWRNRFGHPKPVVLARYAAAQVEVLNTATQGAIPLDFPRQAPPSAEPGWRLRRQRYWRE